MAAYPYCTTMDLYLFVTEHAWTTTSYLQNRPISYAKSFIQGCGLHCVWGILGNSCRDVGYIVCEGSLVIHTGCGLHCVRGILGNSYWDVGYSVWEGSLVIVQDVFRPTPGIINYTGVTWRWGPLSHAQNAVCNPSTRTNIKKENTASLHLFEEGNIMVLSCFISLNSGVCVLAFSSKSAMGHLHTLSTFGEL